MAWTDVFTGGSGPKIMGPGEAAMYGIESDLQTQPFAYLLQAAQALGKKVTINGKVYDFSGKGAADLAGPLSDKMAQTLLDLQKEKSPAAIQARLNELQAADPKGFAARKQLFDAVVADAKSNPTSPVNANLQSQLQDELARGAGFSDAKQEEQAREGVRGGQAAHGIFLGNAPTVQEAGAVENAGESLRTQRQNNALKFAQSGASPEDIAYARFQKAIGNLGNVSNMAPPSADFPNLRSTPVTPFPGTGNPSSAPSLSPGQGYSDAYSMYRGDVDWSNAQMNPFLAGLTIAGTAAGPFVAAAGRQQPGGTPPAQNYSYGYSAPLASPSSPSPAAGRPLSGGYDYNMQYNPFA